MKIYKKYKKNNKLIAIGALIKWGHLGALFVK
jgi:hypothetical protein